MVASVAAFLICLALAFFDTPGDPRFSLRKETVHPSVVQIGRHCSGFIAKKGYVITAGHCIKGPGDVQVHFANETAKPFKVISYPLSPCHGAYCDVALLKGDTSAGMPAKLQPSDPIDEEMCYHVGHPRGIHTQRNGFAKIIYKKEKDFHFAGTIFHGDSGSPLFNWHGEVIGVIHSAYMRPHVPWAAAADIDYAIELLDEAVARSGGKEDQSKSPKSQ